MKALKLSVKRRLTADKRFVRQRRIHPNFCFAKTSFMLESLYAICRVKGNVKYEKTSI